MMEEDDERIVSSATLVVGYDDMALKVGYCVL